MEAIIGLGESGCNVAVQYFNKTRRKYKLILLNTAKDDLNKITEPSAIKLVVGKGEGSGRNPKKTVEIFSEVRDKVQDFLKQVLLDDTEVDEVNIFAGLGGGTGSGSLPFIIDILLQMNITVKTTMILPLSLEGNPSCSNALALLQKINTDYIENGLITAVIVNNDDYQKHLGKGGGFTWYDVNSKIVDACIKMFDFDSFRGNPKLNGLKSLDKEEFKRIVYPDKQYHGFLNIFELSLKNGPDSLSIDFDLSKGKKAIVLFKTKKPITISVLEKLNMWVPYFKIVAESDCEDGQDACYILINGLPLPDTLLGQRLKEVQDQIKGLKKENKSKKVSNINSDELLDI